MSRTLTPTNFPINAKMDLAEYLAQLPNFNVQVGLIRMLINDGDFMIRSAVQAATKYVREEIIGLDANETFEELAAAVTALQLSEISFFEAGNDHASLIETVQHLTELRTHWIELATDAYKMIDGERRTLVQLNWAQPAKRNTFTVDSIEDQFSNPKFNVSAAARERSRQIVLKTMRELGRPSNEADNAVAAVDKRLERNAENSAAKFRSLAPVYCAMYQQILRANVRDMRIMEVVGDHHSTPDSSGRALIIAPRTFATLHPAVRYTLFAKMQENAQKWIEWQAEYRMTDEEWAVRYALANKVSDDMACVLRAPEMKALVAAELSTV